MAATEAGRSLEFLRSAAHAEKNRRAATMVVFIVAGVWLSLALIMLVRWGVVSVLRKYRPQYFQQPATRQRNRWYIAILVVCVAGPLIASAYCEGRSRGDRPYGLFMLGVYAISLVLFAIGQARAHRYPRANTTMVAAVFTMMTIAVALLFLLNFGSNFSL